MSAWRRSRAILPVLCILHLALTSALPAADALAVGSPAALQFGVWQVELTLTETVENPFFDVELRIVFTRPDGSDVEADAFYQGETTWAGRAYCDQVGRWGWRSSSNQSSLNGKSGTFEVKPSDLPGKLRKHPDDPFQFARDDGSWFLHIGDTGYRYVVASEPHWKAYIDQAAEAGFTKIRTWFAQSRSKVEALYREDRTGLALDYWREIDRRLLYALEHHPHVVFQLMPYAEDTAELKRYAARDRMAMLIGRASQARWSALPNVYWAISNDREVVDQGPLTGRKVHWETIDRIAGDFVRREPWGTLLTNHQSRFSGYAFVNAPWSDVITLEDIDQVDGRIFPEYREIGSDPIVIDEDRYELYRDAGNKRYFFRRLMWASLLSGGHATYGGLKTYEAHDGGPGRGVRGYFDACRDGTLFQGAHDFRSIHRFFKESGLTLVGLEPDDALVGGHPLRAKCARDQKTIIVYLANPTGETPESDNPAGRKPSVQLSLPAGRYSVRWFDPRTGEWLDGKAVEGAARRKLTAPAAQRTLAGDWVLLLRRDEEAGTGGGSTR